MLHMLLLCTAIGAVLGGTPTPPPATPVPVKICFELPGTHPVRVTVVAVDKDQPSWIVSHIAYGTTFANNETTGCVEWDGIDENGWPVPPGTYGLKGITTAAANWTADNKFHSVVAKFTGAITPFNVSLDAPANEQILFVDGDPVGNSFTTVATSANFPAQHFANFYHGYLENAMNNYLLDLNQPHGYPQHVNRWHSAGIGGGHATCTDGKTIWSVAAAFGHFLYRGIAGTENVGQWGSANFSNFYTFPGVVPIPAGNVVVKMEATPGAAAGSAVVYTLISGNASALWAMDGYDPTAKMLWSRKLPASTANTTVTSFAIRNSVLYTLTSGGIVTREPLTPAGIPPVAATAATAAAGGTSSFNLTELVYHASCQECGNRTTVQNMGEMAVLTVDSQGTAYVFSGQNDHGGKEVLFAVNASDIIVGNMRSAGTDPSGAISQKSFYGIRSLATWVNTSTGHEYMIILEANGPGRYFQFGLGLTNATSQHRNFNGVQVVEIWNNIESGSNSGWIYDPRDLGYGWVVKYRDVSRCGASKHSTGECDQSGVRKYPAAQGDLVKFRMNGTYGDFVMEESYAGLCTIFLLGNWCPEGECNTCGRPIIKEHTNGNRYLAFQDRNKAVFKWNATQRTFVPSAGIVISFVNSTGCGNQPVCFQKIYYAWHDSDNNGGWEICNNNRCEPDFNELRIVENGDGETWQYNYFVDLMQDDFSFVGVAELGYWQWKVLGLDAHANPIYDFKGPQPLFNDPVIAARHSFNATSDKQICEVCRGLPPTRGGNEVSASVRGSRTSLRFVNDAQTVAIGCMGATGSQFLKQGCFSADACPQFKLAWYQKDKASGNWTNVWRTGLVSLGGVTGANQFANGKPQKKEGGAIEPQMVHRVIGNTVSITDQMRAGIFVYTTDGIYIDTIGLPPGGAPGYRKSFDFGTGTVFNFPGEYFGGGEVFVDPGTGQVHLAWGKTTVQAYTVPGWTKDGIATSPVKFTKPTVTLVPANIALPAAISSQIRGFPPVFANLTVKPAKSPPALDGSMAGWSEAVAATMKVDGLNVNGPAQIEMRLLHSNTEDALFIHMVINQSLTGWPIVPTDLEPASRMFIHSRAATTCSMYIQGNVSHGPAVAPDVNSVPTREPWEPMQRSFTPPWAEQLFSSTVRPHQHQQQQSTRARQQVPNLRPDAKPGDARLVFGLFNDTSLNGGKGSLDVAVLGVYPYWDKELGPATPVTYAAGTGTVQYANVKLIDGLKKGYQLSTDGSLLSLAVQIPRSTIPYLPKFGSGHFLTGGDFSCNIQGFEKDWWVNADLQASQITWDEPSEANFYPNSWGNFSFDTAG